MSEELDSDHSVFGALLVIGLLHRAASKPKKYEVVPVWVTIEIALTNYIIRRGGLARVIYSWIRRYGGSLFGVTSVHQVLVNFPGVDRLMSQSHHSLTVDPIQYTICIRSFGATGMPLIKKKFERSFKDLTEPVERLFLKDAAATEAIQKGDVPRKAASFVSFSDEPQHMSRWELLAGIRVVTPDLPGHTGVVETNLHSLTRDFGACFAMPLLFGQDFLDRCPSLLEDFWKFDNDLFPLNMIGIPTWAPFRVVKEGVAARSRLQDEMAALHRRIDQHQRGEPVDFGADMSDISITALGRYKVFERDEWSNRERAEADFGILWGQNANTQPLLFWFLAYVYSTPGLLEELRQEISTYIQLSETSPREIISIDIPALCRNCQFMKACIFETYRMANEATSMRYVKRPITVNDGAYKHQLKSGTFVTVPHSLIQRDSSVFPDPDEFVPDRFLETDPESGKRVARYGRLKPWGSGAAMCKGRTFAEKEIMTLGAAIISVWDIGPAAGAWKLPEMVPGTGAKKPVEDIRVVIKRRAF